MALTPDTATTVIPATEGYELLTADSSGGVRSAPVIGWKLRIAGDIVICTAPVLLGGVSVPVDPSSQGILCPDGQVHVDGGYFDSAEDWFRTVTAIRWEADGCPVQGQA